MFELDKISDSIENLGTAQTIKRFDSHLRERVRAELSVDSRLQILKAVEAGEEEEKRNGDDPQIGKYFVLCLFYVGALHRRQVGATSLPQHFRQIGLTE